MLEKRYLPSIFEVLSLFFFHSSLAVFFLTVVFPISPEINALFVLHCPSALLGTQAYKHTYAHVYALNPALFYPSVITFL